MKKIFYSLIALLVLGWTDLNAQDYCIPDGNMHSNGKTYVKKIETTGLEQNLGKEWSSTPDNVYQLINEEINVYTGTTFNVIYTANEVGPASTSTVYQDLRFTRAFIFTDWDGDGTFEKINTLGIASPSSNTTPNHILANYNTVMNINQEFTVPEDAYIGQVRIRIIYHNAWLGEATACMTNISDGMAYDIKVNVKTMPSRTVTVQSGENGIANITQPTGGESGSIETNKPVTVEATANDKYEFKWWSDEKGNIVSTENPFIYTGEKDITLTANFNYGPYPEMKRKYQAANQQNRYLKKVSYFIGNEEKTVFEATTQAELPYTAMPTPVETATTVGALIDKTATKIVLPQGTTEFKMKFNAWTPQINSNNQELVWTSQAYYIDFDHSLSFEGNTDGVNEISDIAGSSGTNNKFGDDNGSANDGWTRTITLPSNLAPDTYRMRVVYYDGSNWNTSLFTTLNGTIQSGIAYDFDIVIEGTEPAVRRVTVKANPTEGGSVKITSPGDITGNTVETSEPVTVVAEANPGYRFINWTKGDGTSVSTTQKYTYSGMNDVELTANFEKITNRAFLTRKGELNTNGDGYVAGSLVRGHISANILGEQPTEMTMAAWVSIGGPRFGSVDKAKPNWGDVNNMGKGVIGVRQTQMMGYGSKPAFAVVVSGENTDNNTYKLAAFMKESSLSDPIEVPNTWFHLAFSLKYENSNTTMIMFVNGVEKARITLASNILNQLSNFPQLCIGDNMSCRFDDIMIWNTALDASTIAASMKGYTDDIIINQANLVGYYTCDDLINGNAVSKNLVESKSEYSFKRVELTYGASNNFNDNCTVSDYTTGQSVSERTTPRGGEKFFEGENDATWLTNGNEANFGYIVKTDNIKRLAYNGADKVALDDDVLAVYHNGNPALPTFVRQSDIITNAELEVPQIQSSYVAAGLEYTMTMPSTAKTEWMPISLPIGIDAVADITTDKTKLLRPGYNFWYAQVSPDYLATNSGNIWVNIAKQEGIIDGTYVLEPGIISVPEGRITHNFTFFTQINQPVVIRAFNSEFNKTLMPAAGTIKYIQNPYSFKVNALNVAGIYPDSIPNEAVTVYRFNKVSGNFDPLNPVKDNADAVLNAFEPFFVHDSNNGVSQAPRYIGTKDVSGIVEFEAVYDVNVRGTENAVEVETFQNTEVQIYTLDGVMVAADEVEGTREFELPVGIYVVKTTVEGENKSFKVVVE